MGCLNMTFEVMMSKFQEAQSFNLHELAALVRHVMKETVKYVEGIRF